MNKLCDRIKAAREYVLALEALGLDVGAARTGLATLEAAQEIGECPEGERVWQCTSVPPTTEAHFLNGRPEVLHPNTMFPGFAYSLTAGMRRWFEENTGLVVSRTVTVLAIELWPNTRHPRSVEVASNVHVPADRRARTQSRWVVYNPTRFFRQCSEWDTETHKVSNRTGAKNQVEKVTVPKGKKSLDDMMKEFGLE